MSSVIYVGRHSDLQEKVLESLSDLLEGELSFLLVKNPNNYPNKPLLNLTHKCMISKGKL